MARPKTQLMLFLVVFVTEVTSWCYASENCSNCWFKWGITGASSVIYGNSLVI